jgi:hypothetical protein
MGLMLPASYDGHVNYCLMGHYPVISGSCGAVRHLAAVNEVLAFRMIVTAMMQG